MQLPIKLELLISIVLLATLSCARQAPPESVDLLIINARVIVGTGDVHNRATIAIRGERILAIADTERQFNARVTIDAEDKTVLPGLINMHIHIGTGGRFADEEELAAYVKNELPAAFQDYLSHGVTSIKSVGDIPGPFIEVRERLAQGEIQGPRLFLAGTPLTAVDGHPAITAYRDNPWHRASWTRELDSEAEARSVVAEMAEMGVDAIKFIYHGSADGSTPYLIAGVPARKLTPEIMRAIIDESHQHQLPVTAHTAELEDVVAVVEAGVDGLEHGVTASLIPDERLGALLQERGTFYVPTLSGYLRRRPEMAETLMPNMKQLAGQDIRFVLGTDGGPSLGGSGLDTLKELERMVEGGMSPERAIQAATRNAAELLGQLDELGTLEPGKLADLFIVDGDPRVDIAMLRNIEVVIKGGKIVADHR